MSIREGLLRVEKKWAWSFFGFLLAIIFGFIAIYSSFLQDKNPNLEFIIEGKTPVLDLREDIKNLDILYKGINIKEQNKNLSVITLKIINNSNVNILKEFYDDLSPLKVGVSNGNIVDKPQVILTTNNYLKNNVKVKLDSLGFVNLPKLILEGQESYSISLLVLHPNSVEPSIKAYGKIAGQKNDIRVISNYQQKNKKSFWDTLIYGNILVHSLRFTIYILALMIILIVIMIPSLLISDAITDRKKKNRVKKYKTRKNIKNSVESDAVFDLYLDNSFEELIRIQRLLGDKDKLIKKIKELEYKDQEIEHIHPNSIDNKKELYENKRILLSSDGLLVNRDEFAIRELKRMDMIKIESNELIINENFKIFLTDFISYLKLV